MPEIAEIAKNAGGIYSQPMVCNDLSQCHFYHTLDLPGFGLVRGEWDLRGEFPEYVDHYDFTGKRVLDIGAASGFITFAAEAAGAREVVSFDMDSSWCQDFLPFHQSHSFRDREGYAKEHDEGIQRWRNGYWLAHAAMGSKARMFYGDVYRLPPTLGMFDVVIVGSVLEHLADPIKALASISRVTGDTIIIITEMLETDEKIARFAGDSTKPEQNYVFWTYSRGIYHEVLAMLNFDIERITAGDFIANWDGGKRHKRSIITTRRRASR